VTLLSRTRTTDASTRARNCADIDGGRSGWHLKQLEGDRALWHLVRRSHLYAT